MKVGLVIKVKIKYYIYGTAKWKSILWLLFFVLILLSEKLIASEWMKSADQLESGNWTVSLYGGASATEPEILMKGSGGIVVPITGGNNTVISNSSSRIKLEEYVESHMAAVSFRPHDNGLTYSFKIGEVKSSSIEFSSGTFTNKLSGFDGYIWGVGFGYNVIPDTIVSMGIQIDFSYSNTVIGLDKFNSQLGVFSVNEQLIQNEFQLSSLVSKRIQIFEPFGGLKFNRVSTILYDKDLKSRVSGVVYGVIPTVGIKVNYAPKQSVIVEVSGVSEQAVRAGFILQF
ncbi:MAG: hypothetical protein ACKVQC_00100 [Elusimicrobiota bacterium]